MLHVKTLNLEEDGDILSFRMLQMKGLNCIRIASFLDSIGSTKSAINEYLAAERMFLLLMEMNITEENRVCIAETFLTCIYERISVLSKRKKRWRLKITQRFRNLIMLLE